MITKNKIWSGDMKVGYKVRLLQILLNNAKPKLSLFTSSKRFSTVEVQALWDNNDLKYFHQIGGRELRINLNGREFDLSNYIKINGIQIINILNQTYQNNAF